MSAQNPEQTGKPGIARKWSFGLIVLAAMYGVVELIAFLGFRPVTGSSFGEAMETARSLATRAEAAATTGPASQPLGEDAGTASGPPTEAATDTLDAASAERVVDPARPAVADTALARIRDAREQAGLGMRDNAMSLHPYFGYVYTPPKPGDPPGRIAVNDDGFLDDKPSVRRREPGKVLVGIFGGSVAGQLGTFFSDRLRAELARIPAFADREIEFIRLGMPGYHQPQQVQQLIYILAQGGEFDLVLNIDGFNEVAVPAALNEPFGANPLFPMNWSMVALDTPDLAVRRHIGAATYLHEHRGDVAGRFLHSPRRYSVLSTLLWTLEDQRLAARRAGHELALQQFQVEEAPYFIRGPERWHTLPHGLIPECVELWKRCSLQMKALCDASGVRYVHLLQPNQYLEHSKTLTREERMKAWEAESPYRAAVEQGYPLMRAAGHDLRDAGVEFHDLSMLYRDIPQTVYADACCHYNRRGNELLCEGIAKAVASSPGDPSW